MGSILLGCLLLEHRCRSMQGIGMYLGDNVYVKRAASNTDTALGAPGYSGLVQLWMMLQLTALHWSGLLGAAPTSR